MYKVTRNKSRRDAICRKMREAKARKKQTITTELSQRDEIPMLPGLRRVVIVIDYDINPKIDIYRLQRTNRVDSYAITKNGDAVGAAGWTNFCKRLSVHYPRLLSLRALDEQ